MKTLTFLITLCLPMLALADDKQALRDLRALYEESVAKGDLEALKPHLADDFTAVMITADEIAGFDGILAYWKKVEEFIGEGGTYQVSIDADDSIFEDNIAIAKGKALERVTMKNGRELELQSLWTAVLRKEGDAWKLVRIHAAIDPVSNPIIDLLGRARLWTYGGIGLVAGVVIGLVLGLLIRRRPKPRPAS